MFTEAVYPQRAGKIEPRGLRRPDAARYVGVSPSKFDEWVGRKILPPPQKIDHIVFWDRAKLDAYFDGLNVEEDEDDSDWQNLIA